MKIFLGYKRLPSSRFLFALTALCMAVILAACALPLTPPATTTAPKATSETTAAPTTAVNESTSTAQSTDTTAEATAVVSDTQEVTPTQAVTATDVTTAATVSAVPAPTEDYEGIPVGFTAEGYPYRGAPDAPITMYEFSDYQCPFCSRYFVQTEPVLDRSYVRTGKVRVVFRDFPLVELHPNAPAAHVTALCMADQGAALYWAMHAQLFQTQSEWNQLPDPASYFANLATTVGADMDQYQACIDSGEKEAIVQQRVQEAMTKGFSGTPSFQFVREATAEVFSLVGAQPYEQFSGMIDTLIAGGTPQTEEATQGDGNNEIPFWATADGLKPNADRPEQTVAGDFYRGNPDAKVVVIEFSDFQCPFCRKHTLETQPALDEKFVDTGEVMWVFKHFPLSIHPQAPAAGAAAECAADQNQFWAMHELLFQSTDSWSISDPTPVFADLATQLKLDTAQFATCLAGEEAAKRVQEDLDAGTPFVRGTPTFIVLYNGQGSIIPGALPADRFSSILQEVLDGLSN